MTERESRQLRRLHYVLMDVETALRAGGRPDSADEMAAAIKGLDLQAAGEFLDHSRSALEAVLLGQRDLPVELVGSILEALADVDDALREAMK